MTPFTALGVELLIGVGVAVFASITALRPVAILWALACLATPFFVRSEQPLAVFCLALVSSQLALRTVDLLRDPTRFTFRQRLWHLVAFFDTRLVTARPRGVQLRLFADAVAWEAVAAGALWLAVVVAHAQTGPVHFALRWGGCAVAVLAGVEAASRLIEVAYALAGFRLPAIHDRAYAALSVREFWGVRWNKAVGGWLRENCHEPFHRRGHASVGIAAAFFVSAVIHCYLILPALGVFWSAVMAIFFLVQLVLLGIERALGVARWRPAAARFWTVGVLLVASPLFIEPFARLLDPLLGS